VLCTATLVAGYYSANGQLYRFAAAELAATDYREKAVSLVLAGGLLGAIAGPNLASATRTLFPAAFAGAYVALMAVALLAMACMAAIRFEAPPQVLNAAGQPARGRPLPELMRQPAFLVAVLGAALGYGVMNLLMAATPLAMQVCGFAFDDAALVLEWHVIGMFAPGFFTGHLIKRYGVLPIMGAGVLLNLACVAVALMGVELHHFGIALFMLGVGWNFLFTGSTALAMTAYRPEEKDRAQAALNFCVFATLAVSSLFSGVLVTTQGWTLLKPDPWHIKSGCAALWGHGMTSQRPAGSGRHAVNDGDIDVGLYACGHARQTGAAQDHGLHTQLAHRIQAGPGQQLACATGSAASCAPVGATV
jgi:predicted MFS family arabinose efflux permease